jgi:hypothetical protein
MFSRLVLVIGTVSVALVWSVIGAEALDASLVIFLAQCRGAVSGLMAL